MYHQLNPSKNSNLSPMETSATLPSQPALMKDIDKNIQISTQRHKLPLGAIVSPLSPFFNERAKNFAVEQAKTNFMEEALNKLNKSAENQQNRFRSSSQSSESKESEGGLSTFSNSTSSSTSNDSTDSNHSFATAISMLEDELPNNLPRISFEEWSKFGISLFTPKLMNPHSNAYYYYPSAQKKETHNASLLGNRPRSKSSVTPSVSVQQLPSEPSCSGSGVGNPNLHQSTSLTTHNSPLARNQLVRGNSLRYRMERYNTSH